MERRERIRDGRVEFWEITREGSSLTEREGVMGGATVTRTALCDTEALAESIAARMIARLDRAGYTLAVSASPEGASSAKGSGEKRARPSFEGLTDKQLDAVINGVRKVAAGDGYKVGTALHKAVSDWQKRVPLAWFLVRHELVEAWAIPGLWEVLAGQPDGVDAEALLTLLRRLPTGGAFNKLFKHGPPPWFTAGFERSLDELLFAAYQRERALFDARESELPAPVRVALDFVRGRSDVPVAPDRAGAILRQIAKVQCDRGIATNHELAQVVDGAVKRPRVGTDVDVRDIALRFGAESAWREAMVDAVTRAAEFSVYRQRDGLVACPLDALVRLLAGAFSFSDNANLARILALLDERCDAPEALVEAASKVTSTERHPLEIRDMLAILAAGRFGDERRPVPEAVDAMLDLSFFSGVYYESIAPYVKGMAALPRERALAFAEKKLESPYGYASGLAPLLAHRDDALLTRFFDHDAANAYLEPRVIAHLGSAALPHLSRVWTKTPRERLPSRHQQVLHALAGAGDRGETVDASWDHHVTFDQEGAEAMKYWDSSYAELRARALKALPMERRTAQVLRCARSKPYPGRALAAAITLDDEGVSAVIEAFLQRRAECDRHELSAALRALGERWLRALEGHREAVRNDADLVAVLREVFSNGAVDALIAQ